MRYFLLFRTGIPEHLLIRLPLPVRTFLGDRSGSYSHRTGSLSVFIRQAPSRTDVGFCAPSESPILRSTPSEALPAFLSFHSTFLQTHFCVSLQPRQRERGSPSGFMCTPGPRAPPYDLPSDPPTPPQAQLLSLCSAGRPFSFFSNEARQVQSFLPVAMLSTKWKQPTGLTLGVYRNGMHSSVLVRMLGAGERLVGWHFPHSEHCPHPLHKPDLASSKLVVLRL